MKPDGFKTWRKRLGLRQKEAADLLGLKKRVIQYYEKGKRDGKNVEIPKSVELACYALSFGIVGFDGETIKQIPMEHDNHLPHPEAPEADNSKAAG